MKKILKEKNKAITLIALVITIVILIILAGVTISLSLGNNGLFNRAKIARQEYLNAQELEQEKINELNARIANGGLIPEKKNLPENTISTAAGTEVKLPDSWSTQTVRQVSLENGEDIISATKVSTVYAVAVGNGQTIPVPYGFWYVGGNLDTGVVISDNIADKYDGVTDKTAHSYATSLQGNQFVWIPCTLDGANNTIKYEKRNIWEGTTQSPNTQCKGYWDMTTTGAEKEQIEKYEGFYVARYEAGLDATITPYTGSKEWGSNVYNLNGIPQSKANKIPWSFISWENAQKNAENMYTTSTFTQNGITKKYSDYVRSGLITGTQWDTMISKIGSFKNNNTPIYPLTNSSSWGNFYDNSITFSGEASTYSNNSYQAFADIGRDSTIANGIIILKTGSSENTKAYNLYDVAGNMSEWTEEISFYGGNTSTQYHNLRGGSCGVDGSTYGSASYRDGRSNIATTGADFGFRTVLYLK